MVAVRHRTESKLLAAIRLAVGARPDFMLSRVNAGVYCAPDNSQVRIRTAPNGFPDIIGTQLRRVKITRKMESTFGRYEDEIWRYYGQAIAIETKAPRGKQSEAQAAWQAAFEAVGGVYVLPRSVEEVLAVLGEEPDWVREFHRERNIHLVGQ